MLDTELLRKYAKPVAVLDSCKGAECEKEKAKEEDGEEGKALDAAGLAAAHALSDVAFEAAAVVQAWLEEEPEEGENYADVLQDMFFEDADMNEDGELNDDETVLIDARLNAAYDYMLSKGASEEDAYKLLSEWNADAAERVHDLLVEKMPDGEAANADIDNFVFGDESEEAVLDSAFKWVNAVRNGKKKRVHQRVSGVARRSVAQRAALAKARLKSHSGKANTKRLKSNRVRKALGL